MTTIHDFYLVGYHQPVKINLETDESTHTGMGVASVSDFSAQSKQSNFIAMVSPGAQEVQVISGMFASVTIAQAIWETGWGGSRPVDVDTGEDSYNMFGIKAADGEPAVKCVTWEEMDYLPANYVRYVQLASGRYKVWIYDYFRKFSSITECIIFRAQWLMRSKYWTKARTADTAELAIHYLQNTGYGVSYATDSTYEANILSVINQYNLKQYDLTKEEIAMIQELQNKVSTLESQMQTVLNTLDAHIALINRVVPRPADQQTVADWAKNGHDYVITTKVPGTDTGISDGTRPEDHVTRQELWTMLEHTAKVNGR